MWNPDQLPALLAAACVATASGHAATPYSDLDRYQTPVPFAGDRGWHITHNLGPTGMRAWIDWNFPASFDTSPSREILIRSVEAGSPADGILRPYDIILGVATEPGGDPVPFTSDARLAFARAITMAESTAGNGELKLLCWRDGGTGVVTLRIPVMGEYSDDPPPDCPKTMKIVARAAEAVSGMVPAAGEGGLIGAWNGLFLMAAGEARHLDAVRRTAHHIAASPIGEAGHNTWPWGNVNLFLCEYYLATGDPAVLPKIAEYSRRLVDGQCNPGTWGHRGVEGRIPPGYGSVNSAGVVAFLSLVTARECGVDFDHRALVDSIRFYGGYAGRGGIPYGDHPPTQGSADNGKNGGAAIAFHLLGGERPAQWFARLAASSNLADFEGGHTGNFFNQFWTPLGASIAGDRNYRDFRAAFHHYRDLARRWDGTFITQPQPHGREGCLGFGSYINRGPQWSTAGFGLSLLGGTGELAILGRTRSVFQPGTPAALAPALEHYHGKDFHAAYEAATELAGSDDPEVAELAGQLARAARRNAESIVHTLEAMRADLDEGDLFYVKSRLDSLAPLLDADDPRLAPFHDALRESGDVVESGRLFHDIVGGYTMGGHQGYVFFEPGPMPQDNRRTRSTLNRIADGPESIYREQAVEWLAEMDSDPDATHAVLVDSLDVKSPGATATFQLGDPDGVTGLDFTWTHNSAGPMRVSLNGTTILDFPEALSSGDTTVPLKPSTLELLQRGANELSVRIETGERDAEVSVTLEGWAEN